MSRKSSFAKRFLMLSAALTLGSALAQQPVTLRFMYWGSAFEKQAIEAMARKFEAENPGIKIQTEHVPNDYMTKMNTLIAAGKEPDIAYMGMGDALPLAQKGKILDLTSYAKQNPELGQRIPELMGYYAPGKTIGSSTAGESMQIFYNKQMFKDAGIAAPPVTAATAWTWDQFVSTAKKLTLDRSGKNATQAGFDPKDIKQYGVSMGTWWAIWLPLLASNGAAITDATGTKYAMNSQQAVEVFQKMQDLIYKDHVAPTPTQMATFPITAQQLQTKRVAMVIDGQWSLLDMAASKVDFGMGVLPKFKTPKTAILGAGTVIFASTKNKEAALKFYLFHNDPTKVDLFKQGLWMPLQKKYYTNAALIDSWSQNDVHPPEFKTAVIDYVMKNAIKQPDAVLKNYNKIDPVITAGLDGLWQGKVDAKTALDALAPKVQPLLQGLWPSK